MYPEYNMNNLYYGVDNFNYRDNYSFRNVSQPNIYREEIITLNQAIELIRQSVKNEREDELFYDRLLEQASTDKEKEIITSIRNDGRKHNQILRNLYFNFTGQVIQADMPIQNINNVSTYQENLEKALFGELNAVVKYRKILGTMPSGDSYTLLMSIMTDELRHASKYNFLIHNAK